MAFPFFIFLVPIFVFSLSFFQMPSSVSATKLVAAGTLLCSTLDKPPGQTEPVPVPWAKVQMWEADGGAGDPDDFLAKQQTTDGSFRLEGKHSETFGDEEPYLYVDHNCRSAGPPNNLTLPAGCFYASSIDLLQLYKDIGQDTDSADVWTVTDLKIVLGADNATAGGKEHKVNTYKRCDTS